MSGLENQQKLKIYLSKSGTGSLDILMKVRSILATFANIEVLEFEGGTYNPNLLNSADYVLVIPQTLPEPFKDTFYLSKGQYTESDSTPDWNKIIYSVIVGDSIYVVNKYDIIEEEIFEKDWKKQYALISFDTLVIIDIKEYLDLELISNNTNSKSESSNKKLLLCMKKR